MSSDATLFYYWSDALVGIREIHFSHRIKYKWEETMES